MENCNGAIFDGVDGGTFDPTPHLSRAGCVRQNGTKVGFALESLRLADTEQLAEDAPEDCVPRRQSGNVSSR